MKNLVKDVTKVDQLSNNNNYVESPVEAFP